MWQLFDTLKAKESEIYRPRFLIIVSRQNVIFFTHKCNA